MSACSTSVTERFLFRENEGRRRVHEQLKNCGFTQEHAV